MDQKRINTVITLLCAVQVIHETMDDLQDTEYYRRDVKQVAKRFEEVLTKAFDARIKQVLLQDEDIFNLIMEGVTEISKKLAMMDPAVIAKVALIIEQEKQNHKDELEGISPTSGENIIDSV